MGAADTQLGERRRRQLGTFLGRYSLLSSAARRGSAFGEQHVSDLSLPAARPSALLEPLTGGERDVLRLLLAGASNREIARRLVLSVNTVKRHVYNLCGKLGVQSRTQAILRARTLNLP